MMTVEHKTELEKLARKSSRRTLDTLLTFLRCLPTGFFGQVTAVDLDIAQGIVEGELKRKQEAQP